MAGFCECGSEPSSAIKNEEFLDQLGCCFFFLRKDSSLWSSLVNVFVC